MDGADEDMDLETAQAQINMSVAFLDDLVSGWMKESKAKLPSQPRGDEEKELEEYMRRPPRYVHLHDIKSNSAHLAPISIPTTT